MKCKTDAEIAALSVIAFAVCVGVVVVTCAWFWGML